MIRYTPSFALPAIAVLAAALGGTAASFAGPSCCQAGRQPVANKPKAASAVPFKPSHAPGVVVRHVPSAARSVARPGSIAILPGGTMPTAPPPAPKQATRAATESIVTPHGEVMVYAPEGSTSYATATVSPSGRAVVKCVEGSTGAASGASARPAKPKARTAPTARKAVRH